MKIIILGRGHKIVDIPESLSAKRGEVVVATSDQTLLRILAERRVARIAIDPRTVKLTDPRLLPTSDDLLVVSDYEEEPLRQTLDNLLAQQPVAPVLVFTGLPLGGLGPAYPSVFFKSDRTVLRTEMRDLIRRASTTQKVDHLRRLVKDSTGVVTVIWGNPDPDAIASAFALGDLISSQGKPYTISYMGEPARPENIAMIRTLRIPTVKFSPALMKPGLLLATVDAQPSFFLATDGLKFDIVIDHHPLADVGDPRYSDVRPTYGATSTIMTEYFQNTGLRMNRRIATALFYGLKTDTGNLTRNVSDADVNAFRWLRNHVDENILRTIELSYMPPSMLDHFGIAIANKKIARDTAFTYIGTVENPETCVYIADFFIKISGIGWVIVACRTKEKVVVVFRSDGLRKHAGRDAESLFSAYGSAGGHRTMARAELPLEKLAPEVPQPTDIAVERWLLGKLAEVRKPMARFLV